MTTEFWQHQARLAEMERDVAKTQVEVLKNVILAYVHHVDDMHGSDLLFRSGSIRWGVAQEPYIDRHGNLGNKTREFLQAAVIDGEWDWTKIEEE